MEYYPDGIYVEFFAVKDNVRYSAEIVSLMDLMKALTNGQMDAIENTLKDVISKER